MDDDFKRISSFKSKAIIVGELKGSEVICPELGASPFLSNYLTESGYATQLHEPLRLNSRYFAYHDKLLYSFQDILPFQVRETLKEGLFEEVGEINEFQLVFHKHPALDTYLYSHRFSLKTRLPEKDYVLQQEKPIFIGTYGASGGIRHNNTYIPCLCYRNRVIAIKGLQYHHVSASTELPSGDVLLVKHVVLTQERAFEKMKIHVDAFERFEKAVKSKRDPLPEEVKMFVWRRDEGKCVRCGGQRNLEFDHIIPLSAGGSNTERNIQLLCESCNRQKSNNI